MIFAFAGEDSHAALESQAHQNNSEVQGAPNRFVCRPLLPLSSNLSSPPPPPQDSSTPARPPDGLQRESTPPRITDTARVVSCAIRRGVRFAFVLMRP